MPLVCSPDCEELWAQLPHFMLEIEVGLEIFHHAAEFTESERLVAVAQGLFRTGMNFHDQSVCANHGSGPRQHGNQRAHACGVTWVHDDREVRDRFQYRHGSDVERVASRGFEGANAAFAKNDLRIPCDGDYLRGA